MKTRNGFVSNSSSTSFIITNKTNNDLTLLDFVNETPELVNKFKRDYGYNNNEGYNQEKMIACAKKRNETLHLGDNEVEYGDNDGDTLGTVYDYMLRGGGETTRFKWCYLESNR